MTDADARCGATNASRGPCGRHYVCELPAEHEHEHMATMRLTPRRVVLRWGYDAREPLAAIRAAHGLPTAPAGTPNRATASLSVVDGVASWVVSMVPTELRDELRGAS